MSLPGGHKRCTLLQVQKGQDWSKRYADRFLYDLCYLFPINPSHNKANPTLCLTPTYYYCPYINLSASGQNCRAMCTNKGGHRDAFSVFHLQGGAGYPGISLPPPPPQILETNKNILYNHKLQVFLITLVWVKMGSLRALNKKKILGEGMSPDPLIDGGVLS